MNKKQQNKQNVVKPIKRENYEIKVEKKMM